MKREERDRRSERTLKNSIQCEHVQMMDFVLGWVLKLGIILFFIKTLFPKFGSNKIQNILFLKYIRILKINFEY